MPLDPVQAQKPRLAPGGVIELWRSNWALLRQHHVITTIEHFQDPIQKTGLIIEELFIGLRIEHDRWQTATAEVIAEQQARENPVETGDQRVGKQLGM